MSGRRFKVGDLARYVVARSEPMTRFVGEIVEVVAVNVREGDELLGGSVHANADYAFLGPGGERGLAMDYQLAPIDPPPEPLDLRRVEECEVLA
jgi:hypothetical protein